MRLVEAILLTACITAGVFLGLTLRATLVDPADTCTVERIDADTSKTSCE